MDMAPIWLWGCPQRPAYFFAAVVMQQKLIANIKEPNTHALLQGYLLSAHEPIDSGAGRGATRESEGDKSKRLNRKTPKIGFLSIITGITSSCIASL